MVDVHSFSYPFYPGTHSLISNLKQTLLPFGCQEFSQTEIWPQKKGEALVLLHHDYLNYSIPEFRVRSLQRLKLQKSDLQVCLYYCYMTLSFRFTRNHSLEIDSLCFLEVQSFQILRGPWFQNSQSPRYYNYLSVIFFSSLKLILHSLLLKGSLH